MKQKTEILNSILPHQGYINVERLAEYLEISVSSLKANLNGKEIPILKLGYAWIINLEDLKTKMKIYGQDL